VVHVYSYVLEWVMTLRMYKRIRLHAAVSCGKWTANGCGLPERLPLQGAAALCS